MPEPEAGYSPDLTGSVFVPPLGGGGEGTGVVEGGGGEDVGVPEGGGG